MLRRLANATRTSLIYDAGDRLTRIVHRGPTAAVSEEFVYTYDDAGRRIGASDFEDTYGWYDLSVDDWANLSIDGWATLPVGGDATSRVTWTYDPTGQLLTERRSGANGYRTTFTYDPAGNRRTVENLVDGVVTSTYDASNRLLKSEALSGITTYTYDAAGNRRTVEEPSGDITTSTWDAQNHLVQVELPTSEIVTYTWAPINKANEERLVQRDDGVDVRRYLWDNNNVLRETDDLGAVQTQYTYAAQLYGDLISQHQDGDSTFHQYDAVGSTTGLTDESGVLTDTSRYEAFGKPLAETGPVDTPYRWVGQQGYRHDDTTGDYNLRARDYDPQAARFLSEDPIGLAAGDSNFYRYVANSPINKGDPSGLIDEPQLSELLEYIHWQFKIGHSVSIQIDNDQFTFGPNTSLDLIRGMLQNANFAHVMGMPKPKALDPGLPPTFGPNPLPPVNKPSCLQLAPANAVVIAKFLDEILSDPTPAGIAIREYSKDLHDYANADKTLMKNLPCDRPANVNACSDADVQRMVAIEKFQRMLAEAFQGLSEEAQSEIQGLVSSPEFWLMVAGVLLIQTNPETGPLFDACLAAVAVLALGSEACAVLQEFAEIISILSRAKTCREISKAADKLRTLAAKLARDVAVIAALSAAAAAGNSIGQALNPSKCPNPTGTPPEPKPKPKPKKCRLTATTAREAVAEATSQANALQGTPAEKAALLEELLTEAKECIDGFDFSTQPSTDGSFIFVGQYGEARVVHPTSGVIYGGKFTPVSNGFEFTPNGATPIYPNLTIK